MTDDTYHDTCRFALSSNLAQVSEHLRTKHETTGAERRQVTDLFRARMPKLRNPNDAPAREDGSSSDPNLHVVHGYRCKFCIERTGSSQTISRHIALNHEEERLRLGVQRKAMYEPVFLQAWTRSSPGGRYWIVAQGGSTVRPVGGKEAHDHLKGVFEREQGKQRLRKEMALADGAEINNSPQSTRFTDLKPWLERTGWEQTYQGVDRELLKNLTVVPANGRSLQLPCSVTCDFESLVAADEYEMMVSYSSILNCRVPQIVTYPLFILTYASISDLFP
ncbi:hypothetical protein QWA68_016320 [Fusarium oxysporum]|nr:hypothetical protein QWA68_016320 [Fusarium oxysporum]